MARFLVIAVLTLSPVFAQTFEVASVKPNNSGDIHGGLHREPGGRITATNLTLATLIGYAWQVPGFLMTGAPKWVSYERYDIVAKLEGDPPVAPDPLAPAMRALLADRFKLKQHRETREVDVYALVMAKPGGSPGPKLKQSTEDCKGKPPAGVCGMRFGAGGITFGGMPVETFTSGIAGLLGRPVVDKTGLEGNWDFVLKFTVDPPVGAEAPQPDPNAPSIFTALQEQLGLKLQSTRGPAELLVIDNVDRPTPE